MSRLPLKILKYSTVFFSLGKAYNEFVKFQNLIDLAYIEIVTGNEGLLPENKDDILNLSWVILFRLSLIEAIQDEMV